jgi:hypothetical protein
MQAFFHFCKNRVVFYNPALYLPRQTKQTVGFRLRFQPVIPEYSQKPIIATDLDLKPIALYESLCLAGFGYIGNVIKCNAKCALSINPISFFTWRTFFP